MTGVHKHDGGVYHARKKVPEHLQKAVARVLNNGKERQYFLQKSLGTKDLATANRLAKAVLIQFDRVLAQAEALIAERPVRDTLSTHEIRALAEAHYQAMLEQDEEERREGTGSEPVFQSVGKQLREAGVEAYTPFAVGSVPEFGLSDREVYKRAEALEADLAIAKDALARGNLNAVKLEIADLLDIHGLALKPGGEAYRKLGMAVLAAQVRALTDIERRNAGEPVATPAVPVGPLASSTPEGEPTLTTALEGWLKATTHPAGTTAEYSRAVKLFGEMHGDMAVRAVKRSHAVRFRDALREVPRRRPGKLAKAPLPELAEYGKARPELQKNSPATINKQISALQVVHGWAQLNCVFADDFERTTPFEGLALDTPRPRRTVFTVEQLNKLFRAPVFTRHEFPEGGKGFAAYWLPLLALFTGARQGELAGLRAHDLVDFEGVFLLSFVEDAAVNRTLKTEASERVVPLHNELIRLGFPEFVAAMRSAARGGATWLFPDIAPNARGGGLKAWSKWANRYVDQHATADVDAVFHSFRHQATDALRRVTDLELRTALVGHAHQGVHSGYGAQGRHAMVERFGLEKLRAAINGVAYKGLDLSEVKAYASSSHNAHRGTKGKAK